MKMLRPRREHRIGAKLAPGVAAAVFVGAWLLGVREWGVLLGGGFGWLPAAFLGAIAGLLTYVAPLPAVALAVAVAVTWFWRGGLG